MTRELNVISDIQACDAIVNSECCTLGWDATTLDGMHLNGVYVSTNKKEKFLISIAHLAQPNTKHYKEHILESLNQLAQSYSEFNGDPTDIKII